MATKDDKPIIENRRAPRFEVSLPIRFTEDGETFSEGVVTSISTIGMFIQTQRVPALGGQVWFDLGFGGGIRPVRGRSKVGTLNRRFGTDVVTGFGLEFEPPRDDMAEALTALEPIYPGAVRMDGQGALVWPVPADSDGLDPGAEGDGLKVGTKAGWMGAAADDGGSPVAMGASLNRPMADYLDMIQAANPQILACDGDRIVFAYQGRFLCPVQGITKWSLISGLMALDRELDEARLAETADPESLAAAAAIAPPESPAEPELWTLDLTDVEVVAVAGEEAKAEATDSEAADGAEPSSPTAKPSPSAARDPEATRGRAFLDLLAAQMRIVDDLSCGGWRLEHMWTEQLTSIGQGCELLEKASDRLRAAQDASAQAASEPAQFAITEALQGLNSIRVFMARTLWNARAFTSSDEVFRAYDDWQRAAQAAGLDTRGKGKDATAKKKLFEGGAEPVAAQRRVRQKVPAWRIAVAVSMLGVASVAGYFGVLRSRAILRSGHVVPTGPLTVESIHQAFAEGKSGVELVLDKVETHDRAVRATVPDDWQKKTKIARQREFEALCAVLADKGYTSAVVVTAEGGIERATWHKGVLTIVD